MKRITAEAATPPERVCDHEKHEHTKTRNDEDKSPADLPGPAEAGHYQRRDFFIM
jgi:hypothetical protein